MNRSLGRLGVNIALDVLEVFLAKVVKTRIAKVGLKILTENYK